MKILECRDVSHSYSRGVPALKGVSFSIEEGGFTSLLGANGSGKTTLAGIVSGVIRPTAGSVLLEGRDISEIAHREIARTIAFVPQDIRVDFPFTCMEIVLMGRYSRLSGLGIESEKDHEAANRALEMTGTLHLRERPVQCLSGGERQRIFIAQAIAAEPRLLILDEPVSALDIKYTVKIMNLLKSLNRKLKITVLTILHDLNLASLYSDSAVLLKEGAVQGAGPPKDVLSPEQIKEAYGIEVKSISVDDGGFGFIVPVIGEKATVGQPQA